MFLSNEKIIYNLIKQVESNISELLIKPIIIECTGFEETYGYPSDCKIDGLIEVDGITAEEYEVFYAATGNKYHYDACKGVYNNEMVIFAFDNIDSESINCGIVSCSKLEEFDFNLYVELNKINQSLYRTLI